MASSAAEAAARLSFSSSSSAASFSLLSRTSRRLSRSTLPSSAPFTSLSMSSSSVLASCSSSKASDLETGLSEQLPERGRSTVWAELPLLRARAFVPLPHTVQTTPLTRTACTVAPALPTSPSTASQRLPSRQTMAPRKSRDITTSTWCAPTERDRAAQCAAEAHSRPTSDSEACSIAKTPSAEPTMK
uniref:Uncharacterized protein n=1 Tax=Triticum urartu TaxID=4572 RepID=A0A8R7TJA5_TRIUA